MTAEVTVVARYDPAARAAVEQTLRKLVRRQGVSLIVLGVVWSLVTLMPIIAVAVDGQVDAALFLAVTLVIPVALVVFGLRQLRRHPHLPDVAVTVTPTRVVFPAIERPSALAPRVRAEEWDREGTRAEILPASGALQPARIVFTREDGRTRRRRTVAADTLDVDAQVLVDAVRGPRTSS